MNPYYEGLSRTRQADITRRVDSALIVEKYESRPHHQSLSNRMGAGLTTLSRYVLRTDPEGRQFRRAA